MKIHQRYVAFTTCRDTDSRMSLTKKKVRLATRKTEKIYCREALVLFYLFVGIHISSFLPDQRSIQVNKKYKNLYLFSQNNNVTTLTYYEES